MSRREMYYGKDFSVFRQRERGEWLRKVYDLFMASFKIESKDFSKQQIDYMMKELYYKGSVCVLKDKVGRPLVCPYATNSYNNEDYPVDVTLINHRSIPGLFPDSLMATNMVDCVVGYIRPKRQHTIYEIVNHQVDKITNISVTIEINLFAQKLPVMIVVDPADENNMKEVANKLSRDMGLMFVKANDPSKIQSLTLGNYNIDKLRQERESAVNELLTQLGIDNNNQEKKAQLLSDEVNSNNDEIKKSGEVYINCLKTFADNIKEVLGFDISFEWDNKEIEMEEEDDEERDS